jgi:hypothetical protein
MPDLTPDDIKKNFGRIWPRHVETLTRFLIHCREHFDGDLDLFLVLAVIGDRSFASGVVSVDMDYAGFMDDERQRTPPQPINSLSISSFSRIPRETVRRKVKQLMDRGWVVRDENGHLTATKKAATDLQPLTEISLQYLSQMASTLQSAPDGYKRR